MVIIMGTCVLLGLFVGFQIGHYVGYNSIDWKQSIAVWAAQGFAAGFGTEVPQMGTPFGTSSSLMLGGGNPQIVQLGTMAVMMKAGSMIRARINA